MTTTDALDATLISSPISTGIADFMVFVNDVEQTGIDESDLVSTPFGFELAEQTIMDLDPTLGTDNEVRAVLTLDDGTVIELEATVTGAGFELDGMA